MVNSLILSHLPVRLSHHRRLMFIKDGLTPPTADRIAEALEPENAQDDLKTALRAAAQTAREVVFLDDPGTQEQKPATRDNRVHAVSFWSPRYPKALRAIEDPPWTLFFLGRLPEALPTLAVVGTRRPNAYGAEVIARLLPALKTRPLQLVSGLAYGIDGFAHFHACETGIPNFAVLGCGLDRIYPPEHLDLAARIIASGGGLLTEHPAGTPVRASHFPRRNRIISGLADVVWVVQGAAKSGSYHTAKHALDQNRVVAATPGDIFSELSEVTHKLLFDGAQPVMRAEDLDLLLSRERAGIAC